MCYFVFFSLKNKKSYSKKWLLNKILFFFSFLIYVCSFSSLKIIKIVIEKRKKLKRQILKYITYVYIINIIFNI